MNFDIKAEVESYIKEEFHHGELPFVINSEDFIPDEIIRKALLPTTESPYDYLQNYVDDTYYDAVNEFKEKEFKKMTWFLSKMKSRLTGGEPLTILEKEASWEMLLDGTFANLALEKTPFLNQKVYLDIILKGEMNSLMDATVMEKASVENSGILRLLDRYGLTKENLLDYISKLPDDYFDFDNEEKEPETFLESIAQEVNESVEGGTVKILVCMSLENAIKMSLSLRNGDKFIVKEGTSIGIHNHHVGGGSLFNIKLDKDIELSADDIEEIVPDRTLLYNVERTYFIDHSFWKDYE